MSKDIKQLKNRIRSVESTLQLTKAMGLVASAKIRGATELMTNARQYSSAIYETINALASSPECKKSPYMKQHPQKQRCIIVFAGDRGLAGGYNSNVFKTALQFSDAKIYAVGKRACEKYSCPLQKIEHFDYSDAVNLAKELCESFKNGEFSEIGIVSTKYISMMTQNPEYSTIFPLKESNKKQNTGIIFEPDENTILEAVIEEYVASRLIEAARESFACEVVARRFAMDSAGKNAKQMIDELRLDYNRARQGTITQEITEIVAGSNA